MIKFMTRFKWYRMKHLREFIPNDLKQTYDNINRGVPEDLSKIMYIISITDGIKSKDYKRWI